MKGRCYLGEFLLESSLSYKEKDCQKVAALGGGGGGERGIAHFLKRNKGIANIMNGLKARGKRVNFKRKKG